MLALGSKGEEDGRPMAVRNIEKLRKTGLEIAIFGNPGP